ncbi:hypothetical protein FKM82_025237 [Ascaphus truei]
MPRATDPPCHGSPAAHVIRPRALSAPGQEAPVPHPQPCGRDPAWEKEATARTELYTVWGIREMTRPDWVRWSVLLAQRFFFFFYLTLRSLGSVIFVPRPNKPSCCLIRLALTGRV